MVILSPILTKFRACGALKRLNYTAGSQPQTQSGRTPPSPLRPRDHPARGYRSLILRYSKAIAQVHIVYVFLSESCVTEPSGEVTCVAGDVPSGRSVTVTVTEGISLVPGGRVASDPSVRKGGLLRSGVTTWIVVVSVGAVVRPFPSHENIGKPGRAGREAPWPRREAPPRSAYADGS